MLNYETLLFDKCIEKIKLKKKINKKKYLKNGKFPIVSQDDQVISGFWNNAEDVYKIDKPVIIFGDHTRVLKYIDFDFVVGADGTKIIKTKPNIIPKYFYYFLFSANIKSLGYSRHYKLLKKLKINLPPLPIQQKIVAKLDKIFAEIDKAIEAAEANIRNAEALFQSYISNIKATKSTLGDLVTIKTGKLDSNASEKNGKYPFFTCSKEIFSINDYAFDCEAVLLAGNNASGDFNVKHYKGKFNAYQRTYVITIDAKDRLTYRYLYFQLINALKKFKSISVGANTKFLRIGMIRTLEFPLPKFDEQIKILKKLSTIEEKKELLKNIYLKKLDLFNIFKQSILQQAFNGELVKAA